MPEGVSITIDNKDVQKLLTGVYTRGMNLTPVMKRISVMMRGFSLENFLQEGRPKWKALSQVTLDLRAERKKKLKKGERKEKKLLSNPKILQVRSGDAGLKGSIIAFNNEITAGIGSVTKYAGIHQMGGYAGTNRKVYIPQREYLSPTEEDMEQVYDALQVYLMKGK